MVRTPHVSLVRFGEKQTHNSKVTLFRHLHMFIIIVTCRTLVFFLGLGGDSGEEEPEARVAKVRVHAAPPPPGELALGPGGAAAVQPPHPVQRRAAAVAETGPITPVLSHYFIITIIKISTEILHRSLDFSSQLSRGVVAATASSRMTLYLVVSSAYSPKAAPLSQL